jgi:signal transduction histidine kinase
MAAQGPSNSVEWPNSPLSGPGRSEPFPASQNRHPPLAENSLKPAKYAAYTEVAPCGALCYMSPLEGGGAVGLRAAVRDGSLRVEVSDSGAGFPPDFSLDTGEGHGLRNVMERLRGYYGDRARLFWESHSGATHVVLTLPAAKDHMGCLRP